MRSVLVVLLGVVTFLYPFAVYFGLEHFYPRQLALVLLAVTLFRLYFLKKNRDAGSGPSFSVVVLVAVALYAGYAALDNSEQSLRFYPVFVNFFMLCFFGYTLLRPPTIIEQLARLSHPNLPESGVRYTRKVTTAWCLFFVCSGSIALWTALIGSWTQWMLYNGLISYLLVGAMFSVEWLIRRLFQANQ